MLKLFYKNNNFIWFGNMSMENACDTDKIKSLKLR